MSYVNRKLLVEAEQYSPGKPLPKGARAVGTHGTGIYARCEGKPRLLKKNDFVVSDGFGNVRVMTPKEFRAEYVEVNNV